jgi:hypothetical protein
VYQLLHPAAGGQVQGFASPVGFTPAQIRHAYGFDQARLVGGIQGDGTGQTIAIVDSFDDPNIVQDLATFDAQFGLPAPPSFRRIAQDGSGNLPGTDPAGPTTGIKGDWEGETAMDVEWAHAIAPGANLLLVEANATGIWTAVATAARQPGVSVVSMSFSGDETKGELTLNNAFVTPAGHTGVTFVASSGDSGIPQFPATAPTVLGVGGTSLTLGDGNSYGSETAWSSSGGGFSTIEAIPAWQTSVLPAGTVMRATPDVAWDGDPNTGFAVCDSYNFGSTPWVESAGTSAGAPQWAGLLAIANQGRARRGLRSLDGATETLPMLYSLNAYDFHDITSGSNMGNAAGPGYDLVTGLGTPKVYRVIPELGYPSAAANLGVSNYGAASDTENVFRVQADGNLYVDHLAPGSSWIWVPMGNPGPKLVSSPAVIDSEANVAFFGLVQEQNVFVEGANGNVYLDQYSPLFGWSWQNLGNANGVRPASSLAAVNYGSGSSQSENVFYTGFDGNLYVNHFAQSSGWSGWQSMNNPGIYLVSSPAAIDYQANIPIVGSFQEQRVFVTGVDGNVYELQFDPSGWNWQPALPGPGSGVRFANLPSAINYGSGNSLSENVFLTGDDGNLYVEHYDMSSGWVLVGMGNPGTSLTGSAAAINYDVGAVSLLGGVSQVQNVFVVGGSNLYELQFNPATGWNWLNRGNALSVTFGSNPVAINYGSGISAQENVFITGIDTNLYVDNYSVGILGGWSWANRGHG